MAEINLHRANRFVESELGCIIAELGMGWWLGDYEPIEKVPGKNYSAKGGIQLVNNKTPIQFASVLFQSGDNTGAEAWAPRAKSGEAEFYIALGSSVDGMWISGLTSLACLSEGGGDETMAYKYLSTPREEYLQRLGSGMSGRSNRFDFSFDRARGYGDPHVVGFPHSLEIGALPFQIDYQIGAFALFKEHSDTLTKLRTRFG